ncbi:MAG TPA: ATP-binding protein [Anditalea sp.]|nr:ATP-binding protein [Anditalea sp.]
MISIKKDNDYVKELLKLEEGIHLDFKQSITNQLKISKTMAAFANTKGGKLVIGVSDNRQIIGIDVDEEIFMVEEANKKYITPPVEYTFEIYEINYIDEEKLKEEIHILIVNIEESLSKPHFINSNEMSKTFYIRKADKSLPIIDPTIIQKLSSS